MYNYTNYSYMDLTNEWQRAVLGGAVGTLIAFGILFMILVSCTLCLSLFSLDENCQEDEVQKAWLAWVPFGSSAMRLQRGKFHWAWVFLWIFPPAVIVLLTIATWRIFEKLRYSGWLALSFPLMFIPGVSWLGWIAYLVIIGRVAWGKK